MFKTDSIHITQVSNITLYSDRETNHRRVAGVPQLKCIGGDALSSAFHPDQVTCYNRGSDGINIQWKCIAAMDEKSTIW